MIINENIQEIEQSSKFKDGMFIAINLSTELREDLAELDKIIKIENPLNPMELHQTFLYAKMQCLSKLIHDIRVKDIIFTGEYLVTGMKLENFIDRDGTPLLILTYICPALQMSHTRICDMYNVKHSFPSLMLHFTLSYNTGAPYTDSQIAKMNLELQGVMTRQNKYSLSGFTVAPIQSDYDIKKR